jgi:branched-chain amino acid transport system substrate-binding protein
MAKLTRRTWAVVVAVIVIVVVIAALSAYYMAPPPTPSITGPIKLGTIGSTTGVEAWIPREGMKGLLIAVEEINEKGGINGRPIKIVDYDDAGSPDQAVICARKLVYDDKVPITILNHGSELALPSSRVFVEAKRPALAAWAGHPGIVEGGYVFMVSAASVIEGKALAYYIMKEKGAKTFAAVITVDPYEEKVYSGFKSMVESLGGKIVYEKFVQWGEKEFTAILTEIKALNPDAIIGPNDFTMSIPFDVQARALGIKSILLHGVSSAIEEFARGVKDIADIGGGIYMYARHRPDLPEAQQLATIVLKRFGVPPLWPTYAVYDAVKIAAWALEKAGEDPAKLVETLKELKDFKGTAGTLFKFSNNLPVKEVPICTVTKEGELVLVTTISDPSVIGA